MKARCRLSYSEEATSGRGFDETLVGELRENAVRIDRLPSALGVSGVGYPHTGGLLECAMGVVALTTVTIAALNSGESLG
jgi:hypothetical protein